MSREELGQNNNCWRIVPENTQRSFDLHVIFIRPLSKAPQGLTVLREEPYRAIVGASRSDFLGVMYGVRVCARARVRIYITTVLHIHINACYELGPSCSPCLMGLESLTKCLLNRRGPLSLSLSPLLCPLHSLFVSHSLSLSLSPTHSITSLPPPLIPNQRDGLEVPRAAEYE